MQLTRVVLAALVALGVALVPVTPASAHGNHPGAAASLLIPAAGWHGRATENTDRHPLRRLIVRCVAGPPVPCRSAPATTVREDRTG